MLAIIETGGKQYIVSKGDTIQVEKLPGAAGEKVKFDKVLFTATDKDYILGKPYIKDSAVEGEIVKQGRGDKVVVFKYKAKSKYRRKQGHRQAYTDVKITSL